MLGEVHKGLHDGPVLLRGIHARICPTAHRQVLPRPTPQAGSHDSFPSNKNVYHK